MSLREEISEYLFTMLNKRFNIDTTEYNYNTYSELPKNNKEIFDNIFTNDIIKAIEKRIDSLKQEANGMPDYIDAYNKVNAILK